MSARQRIVTALLWLYPSAWRREYGIELTDILTARPLTAFVIADVAWSGLRQRARASEPSTILGLGAMLANLAGLVLASGQYGRDFTAVVRPSLKTFPTVTVPFMASEYYVLLMIVCGGWTLLRSCGTLNRSGLAAMKMTLIAAIPVLVAGVLIALGLLDVVFAGSGRSHAPTALEVFVAPIARLPDAWLWGAIGGQIARWIAAWRRASPTT